MAQTTTLRVSASETASDMKPEQASDMKPEQASDMKPEQAPVSQHGTSSETEKKTRKPRTVKTYKDNADRFRSVAGTRAAKIVKEIETLGNCADKTTYDYTAVMVERMFDRILTAVEKARGNFRTGKVETKGAGNIFD